MIGRGLEDAFFGMVLLAAAAGAALMGILFWLIPWLWGLAKPGIHALTA